MNLETIEVDVTQEKIDESIHGAICGCPIARSINRGFGEDHFPKIDGASVHLRDGWFTLHEHDENKRVVRTLYAFDLPTAARNFVSTWDAHQEVRPIKFNLKLVNKGIRNNVVPTSR